MSVFKKSPRGLFGRRKRDDEDSSSENGSKKSVDVEKRLSTMGEIKRRVSKHRPKVDVPRSASADAPAAQKSKTEKIRRALEKKRLRIDDFELRETVGTGTFGRVRIVRLKNVNPDKLPPMCLKIVKKATVIQMRQVEHIKAEKDILMSIEHPFIVNLLVAFQDTRRLFLLLEYVNGGELFGLLRRLQVLPNDHARFYAAEIVLAFESLHSQFIIYRDLKPENLLIDSEGHIKITDFGFAKRVEDRTYTLCGTPEYLAPEIIQSKGHGASVDWWALGVLVYEMLCGYPPFYDENNNSMVIYQKIVDGRFFCPRQIEPRAKDLVKKLLVADRTKRFGCMKAGAADIKSHKWFRPVSWEDAFHKRITPPFIPDVKGRDDACMFDSYPDSGEDTSPPLHESQQKKFFDNF
ncbi:MAG: uncharacterized protein KVP18_003539 [Porospora cf. gigantea A]|uniref:uncharacterized protein n=1 Tax=Porospora cf. gigantea A TaxID=2853593 RepID=UPI00355947BF|nr:MAG: hypothetical protein KVP18_003539 [Porospora cf. gigantea A]